MNDKNVLAVKDNSFVIQSNRLIEAHYRLNFQEKRLVLWLIKEIRPDDIDFRKYAVKISEFADFMGLSADNQYDEMKKLTKFLTTRSIELYDPQIRDTRQMAWLSFAHWEPAKGICSVQFHPELKPYLLKLTEHYTKTKYSEFLGLSSGYSIRIFELLNQYESIGRRTTKIEDIKKWCGIGVEEYVLYGHLKERVIEKAKMDINNQTEYEVDYTEIKESRKVVSLEWSIKKRSNKHILAKIEGDYSSLSPLMEVVKGFGISNIEFKRKLKKHNESAIRKAVDVVESFQQKGKVRNAKGLFLAALAADLDPKDFKKK